MFNLTLLSIFASNIIFMGIKDRKIKAKEDLHKSILKAAREIFLEKGFDNMSIRNIAERIEYSPTTIYLYYKDKDAIFHALHLEGFSLLNQQMLVLESVANPIERLKAMGWIYIKFAQENEDYYDLMFVQRAPLNSLELEPWKEGESAFYFLKQTIQECINSKQLSFTDAEVGAFIVWSYMHGMCTLKNRDRCRILSEEKQDNIINLAYESFIKMLEII